MNCMTGVHRGDSLQDAHLACFDVDFNFSAASRKKPERRSFAFAGLGIQAARGLKTVAAKHAAYCRTEARFEYLCDRYFFVGHAAHKYGAVAQFQIFYSRLEFFGCDVEKLVLDITRRLLRRLSHVKCCPA